MNVHIQNVGECQKCGLILTSFLCNLPTYNHKINLTDNPKECDLLIVVGCPIKTQMKPLLNFWRSMSFKHKILNFGNCGTETQDLFTLKNQNLKNKALMFDDLSEALPIDFTLRGCPPTLSQLEDFFTLLKLV